MTKLKGEKPFQEQKNIWQSSTRARDVKNSKF